MRSRSNSGAMLDVYHHQLTKIFLETQHPLTGLTSSRDPQSPYYNHAWIRDNVYCCMAAWGLSLAYKKCTTDKDSESRVNYLEKSVIKLMRGLMTCMMSQSHKVESFKKTQSKYDSLHAKFDAATFKTVIGDYEWGHLQMDAVAVYVLLLAQMTVSGLEIIYNYDEIAFMQNLVYYLEQAYRTPDFGIWERGDKTNRGHVELNASSVGMAKAALQAIHSIDLFGARGSSQSVITAMPDEITQCNVVLESLLPRESNSKETDLALLSILTYPAFAVEDQSLIDRAKNSVCEKLKGDYGCKRFLRDGYKTVVEDPSRLYYESHELKQFENIECEWPIGYCFLLLDALFREDKEATDLYRKKLDALMVPCPEMGFHVLPELYYVPHDKIIHEKVAPNSQDRKPGGKTPHVWGHCMWILTSLICDGLLTIGEIDPLNRRLSTEEKPDVIVQIAAVAETEEVQNALEAENFHVETADDLAHSDMKLRLFHANVLGHLFSKLGECPKMGLTGRTTHDFVGIEATSKFYVVKDSLIAFVPYFLNKQKFYLALDHHFTMNALRLMVQYLKLNWRSLGRPTMILVLSKESLDPLTGKIHDLYLSALQKMSSGLLDGLRVSFGNISSFYGTSSIRRLGFIERVIDEQSENPLESFSSITSHRSAAPSLLCRRKTVNSADLSKRVSVFRTINTSRAMNYKTESSSSSASFHKRSAVTAFLQPKTSTQTLHSNSVKREDLDSASDEDLVDLLQSTASYNEQLDVLVFLNNKYGLHHEIKVGANKPTIKVLLKELYRKSSEISAWSILRYTASMLQKIRENIAPAIVEILVRQKAITIGMPPEPREKTIIRPISADDFTDLLYASCGNTSPLAALTQEIIIYTSLLVRTQPRLFAGMMRIRIGLIIQVLAQEIARSLGQEFEQGMDQLLKLEPHVVYELVYNLFAGREIKMLYSNKCAGEGQSELELEKFSKKDLSRIQMSISNQLQSSDEEEEENTSDDNSGYSRGTWLRRRRIDGSLTRAPVGFYQSVWKLLDRCQEGICVESHMLYAGWTQEMTQDELKFDLKVEEVFSRIAEPEYRQVLIEALMVLANLVEHHYNYQLSTVVQVEDLARHANHLFLIDLNANNTSCPYDKLAIGIKGLSSYFYDSAPSGRYGSLTYLIRASVMFLEATNPSSSHKISCKVT